MGQHETVSGTDGFEHEHWPMCSKQRQTMQRWAGNSTPPIIATQLLRKIFVSTAARAGQEFQRCQPDRPLEYQRSWRQPDPARRPKHLQTHPGMRNEVYLSNKMAGWTVAQLLGKIGVSLVVLPTDSSE
ncbi:MAG: hypothetical protein M3Y76_06585 [Chloroflexota bacterium]|nr:hypothetical protein [Chloroflexota bacterium]